MGFMRGGKECVGGGNGNLGLFGIECGPPQLQKPRSRMPRMTPETPETPAPSTTPKKKKKKKEKKKRLRSAKLANLSTLARNAAHGMKEGLATPPPGGVAGLPYSFKFSEGV
ncbi:hypothetical protein PEX1_099030 [Penicillium expansum]|nr:hypothetical protein PEX1_099030 [Penicillium expansum]